MKIKEGLIEFMRNILLISLIILFFYLSEINFMKEKILLLIATGMFFSLYLPIYLKEKKYKKNRIHKIRRRESFLKSVFVGLLAGFHYLFFIGTYNHKKYNTQVFYPESLECWMGNLSQAIIFIIYINFTRFMFPLISYYTIIFLLIPLGINFYSLKK